jgi:hypothetical protein
MDDPQITYGMFCIDCIIKGINMRYIPPCLIPRHFTTAQKGHCYTFAKCNPEYYYDKDDTFLHHIVVLGETWAQAYEPKLKC